MERSHRVCDGIRGGSHPAEGSSCIDVVGSHPEQYVGRFFWTGPMQRSPCHMLDSISSNAEVDPVWQMILEERGMGRTRKPFKV